MRLNYDAIGARGGHPGAFGLTAPLAVAERVGNVNGKEFIASLVAGVEVEMRAVAALIEAGVDTRQNFLEGQVLSYVGATLSAGRVLRLRPRTDGQRLGPDAHAGLRHSPSGPLRRPAVQGHLRCLPQPRGCAQRPHGQGGAGRPVPRHRGSGRPVQHVLQWRLRAGSSCATAWASGSTS